QAVEVVFSSEVEVESLTPRQLAVLMTVAENEGLSQTGIVDRTGIDRSKLTEAGRRVLGTVEPLAKRVDHRILDALPAKQRDQFMRALASIVSTLERTAPA